MEQYIAIAMVMSTIALTIITYFYLKETRRIAQIAERQLSGNLIPIVILEITPEEHYIYYTTGERRTTLPSNIGYLINVGNGPATDVYYCISGFRHAGKDEKIEGGPLIIGVNSRKRLGDMTPLKNLSEDLKPSEGKPIVYIEYKDISGNYYRTEDVDGEIQHARIPKPQLRIQSSRNT